jgi:cellulose 1,4-beta-cellobiosidase
VGCNEILGIVLYDLPWRNGCPNTASINAYRTEYIDGECLLIRAIYPHSLLVIAKHIRANPNVAVAVVIEPNALPKLVVETPPIICPTTNTATQDGVTYALKSLNLPNVVMYLDMAHGGWLGWDSNTRK